MIRDRDKERSGIGMHTCPMVDRKLKEERDWFGYGSLTFVDGFELKKFLGEGGYGAVHLVVSEEVAQGRIVQKKENWAMRIIKKSSVTTVTQAAEVIQDVKHLTAI
eukprot:gnl/MRDRNA2_/MRDRNA2_67577_c0_seq1.p2 gnl/MRDRNA2_/MRDRNA2_67577_c0~~gnl/MRDRNA2_/MRDRNA2_67577_c0_seq1.p2  ORF type:complete len:106 (+),score=21.80 gnl/MRDRNA2_/MRDRNA2_67577_c0_seq1:518-835(+)